MADDLAVLIETLGLDPTGRRAERRAPITEPRTVRRKPGRRNLKAKVSRGDVLATPKVAWGTRLGDAARDVGKAIGLRESDVQTARDIVNGFTGLGDTLDVVGRTVNDENLPGDWRAPAISAAFGPFGVGPGGLVDFAAAPLAKRYLPKLAGSRLGRYLRDAEAMPEARPAYERVGDGAGHLTVRRKGLVPATVPEAQSARTLGDLRVLTRDYSSNPARQLVDQSAREARGAPYDPDLLPRTSLERQAGIGRAYTEAVSGNPDYDRAIFERYGEMMPEVVEKSGAQNYDQLREAAYLALSDEVRSQFDRLPIQFTYHSGDLEYAVPSAMMRDALGKGNLNVFRGGDPHEFLDRLDPVTGLTDNEMFRAVHDYAGHVAPGSTFRPDGEEIAYATHAQTMSPLAQMALLSETRGQNSLVNYSGLNADIIEPMEIAKRQLKERALAEKYLARGGTDEDRVREALGSLPPAEDLKAQLRELGGRWRYADQKAVLLPPEYLDPLSPGGMPEYLRKVLQTPDAASARGVHISSQPDLVGTDPSFYGTGHRGAEYPGVRAVGGPDRTYFYSGPEGTVTPEESVMGIVGGEMRRGPRYAYEGDLTGLYDLQQDPEGLLALSRAYNLPSYQPALPYYMSKALEGRSPIPDLERLVREYGYKGYITDRGPGQRWAAMYDPVEELRRIERGANGYAEGGLVE